jgi:Tfp pilus assembly protein PilX
MNPHPSKPFVHRERGFALLITITLLAFLVLLLVSLASLTRVETQVAANSQQLSQARQNALMALNIAVGQLQKYAGPDQRTTARADLENGAGKSSGMWTGVYGSSIAADYTDTPSTIQSALTNSSNVNSYGSSARLLNWLVSGNETAAFNPAWGTGDVGTKGQITGYPDPASTTAIPFKPAGTVANLTATTTANDTTLTITNAAGTAKTARLLVGPNSVTSSVDASNQPIDYVVAPAVDITATANTVPGISGSPIIGRYAWWVGDEGVKARINLPLAGTDTDLTATEQLAQKKTAFTSTSRAAVELMAKDTPGWATSLPALNANRIDALYDPSFSTTSKIVDPSQSALASTNSTAMATALKYRFHDVTTQSYSVLSDTYAGGLKQDLTRILPTASVGPASTARLWTPDNSGEDTTFNPSWGHLRSFYSTTATGGVISPQLPVYGNGVAGTSGISPILTYVALGFRYTTATAPATGVAINFNIHPIAVLWNPYNKKMAGGDYEIGIGYLAPDPRILLQVNNVDTSLPNPPDKWETREVRDLRYAGKVVAENAPTGQTLEYFRFKVTCPELKAGESLVFTLDQATGIYTAGVPNLVPGLNPHYYVTLSSTTISAGEADKDYRVIGQGGLKYNNHVCAYLGDGTAPPSNAQGVWDPALNKWYQTIQHVDYGGIQVDHTTSSDTDIEPWPKAPLFADAGKLDIANPLYEPQLKTLLLSIFSSTGKGFTAWDQWGQNIPRYRWIAQANIRAPYQFRSRRDPNMNTPWYSKIGSLSTMWPVWYLQSPSDPEHASSGHGLDYDLTTGDVINAKLFEVRESTQSIFSIGQLQHANLSLANAYPSYAVGNSIADFRLPETSTIVTNQGESASEITTRLSSYYDASWLLNRTLWNRYYFSAIKTDGTFENSRYTTYSKDGSTTSLVKTDQQDYRKAAARLLLSGGFNINSTSEQAWRAIIGGINLLTYNPEGNNGAGSTSSTPLTAAFPRFSNPTAGTTLPSNVTLDASFNGSESQYAWFKGTNMQSLWEGYRTLDENQIAQLARNIVEEVRARGPFLSLADFVNRRLIDNSNFIDNGPNDQYRKRVKKGLTTLQKRQFLNTIKGALQAAIDASYENTTGTYAINTVASDSYWKNTRTMSSLQSGNTSYYSLALARGDLNEDSKDETALVTPSRTTSAFAPKYITQADVLSAIGAGLSARSDTFTIRTYGETVNPVTQEINGRAWCEAVLQRLPDYVADSVDAAETLPADLVDTTNQKFGRTFKIISFRWLSSNDI